MRGASRQSDAGVYGGTGALVDKGVVPEYFHGFDRAGEAGGDIGGDMHG